MNYTIHQLQIFLKIVQLKSVTKAAEELHLSQPATSIQLKNFQMQFDLPIVEIINRRIYVTDFGYEVAKSAESILHEVELLRSKTASFKGQIKGVLKFSAVSTGKYIIPYFLTDFIKQYPATELHIDVTNKKRVLDSLSKNEADFSLVSVQPNFGSFEKIDLMPNRLFLIGCHKQKKLAVESLESILKENSLIFREKGSGTRQLMENFISTKNYKIEKKMTLTSNEAVKQAVLAGLGYSIMPLIGIKNEILNSELKIIPIKGLPIKSTWSLIWPKGKVLSEIAQAYADYLYLEKSNIITRYFDWYDNF